MAALIPVILSALTIHEFAHGFAAYCWGDDTAKMAGRLSLNPFLHLNFLGTISFFLFKIGWAEPTPVNLNNFFYQFLFG